MGINLVHQQPMYCDVCQPSSLPMSRYGIFGPVPQTPSIAWDADSVGLTQSGTRSGGGRRLALPTENRAHTAAESFIIPNFGRALTSCAVLHVGRRYAMRDGAAFHPRGPAFSAAHPLCPSVGMTQNIVLQRAGSARVMLGLGPRGIKVREPPRRI